MGRYSWRLEPNIGDLRYYIGLNGKHRPTRPSGGEGIGTGYTRQMKQIEGYIDGFDQPQTIRGWARVVGKPDQKVEVAVVDQEGRELSKGIANLLRADLAGNCGFSMEIRGGIDLKDILDKRLGVLARSGPVGIFLSVWEGLLQPEND